MSTTNTAPLKLGTRGSLLARTQSQMVAEAINEATGRQVELTIIRTEGDDVSIPLDAPSRPGAFAATLRDALLDGRVDLAVHSFKDLPSAPLPGLSIAAIPRRSDPRDAWCSHDGVRLEDLPAGAKVGTSSPRRAVGIERARADLHIVPIRGNVDTRLRKVAEGEVDAAVLAAAGLLRLGHEDAITEYIDPGTLLPAPAQGALAVECRAGELAAEMAAIDNEDTRLAVVAERAILAGIGATCTTAVGALASWLHDDRMNLVVEVTAHRGIVYDRISRTGHVSTEDEARALGLSICDELLGQMG